MTRFLAESIGLKTTQDSIQVNLLPVFADVNLFFLFLAVDLSKKTLPDGLCPILEAIDEHFFSDPQSFGKFIQLGRLVELTII